MKSKRYIVIIIISIIVMCLSTYITYHYLQNRHKTPEDFTTKMVNKAQDYVDNKLTKNQGLYEWLKGYKGQINELPNSTKLNMIIWYLKNDKDNTSITNYSSNEILEVFRELFGKKYEITFEDIPCNSYEYTDQSICFKYGVESTRYIRMVAGFPVNGIKLLYSKFVDYKEENNQYIVTFKQLFYEKVAYKCPNCYSYDYMGFDGKILYDEKTDDVNFVMKDSEELYKELESQLVIVEYTFELENDNLVLKSINYFK